MVFLDGREPNEQLGIGVIDPTVLSPELLVVRARQLAHVVGDLQQFYGGFPDTERVDTSPPPNPESKADRDWRIGRLLVSGNIDDKGLLYIGLFRLDADEAPLTHDDALAGLIVLGRHENERCTPNKHVPAWIVEFYLRERYRGKGFGGALLREASTHMHPEDLVIADVALPNTAAQDMYRRRYGFRHEQKAGLIDHEVFNFPHIRMSVSGRRFRQKVGSPRQA